METGEELYSVAQETEPRGKLSSSRIWVREGEEYDTCRRGKSVLLFPYFLGSYRLVGHVVWQAVPRETVQELISMRDFAEKKNPGI